MKKFIIAICLSLFAFGLFAQSVTWQSLTNTAELNRTAGFSFFDGYNVYKMGGGLSNEIISYNASDYYVLYSTSSPAYPYYLTSTTKNHFYSKILNKQYIYTEALNTTYNAVSCAGGSPYPGSVIWQSTDGVDWISMTGTATPRNPALVEWNGYIWQLGGNCLCSGAANPTYFNDISKSNTGLTYTAVSTTGIWSIRDEIIPVVNNGRLFVLGGHYKSGSDVYYADVYYTDNGVDWTTATRSAEFGTITSGGVAWSDSNNIWLYKSNTAEIWKSADGVAWSLLPMYGELPGSRVWPLVDYLNLNRVLVTGGGSQTAYMGIITNDFTYTQTPTFTVGGTPSNTPTITPTNTPSTPIITATVSCPIILATVSAPYAANYGAMDNLNNFWVGSYYGDAQGTRLYKISTTGTILNTYYSESGSVEKFGSIVQIAYGLNYLWIGAGQEVNGVATHKGKLTKFNPVTGHTEKYWYLNPDAIGGNGNGGIQGVIFDGANIWAGVSQYGGGLGSGLVLKFNPVTEAIDMTITAQTNVNGLAYATQNGQSFILAACEGFWSKINASTGAVTYKNTINEINNSNLYTGYRIATDNTFVYVAFFENGIPTVKKYNLSDMAFVESWTSGNLLNTILVVDDYVYVAGDDDNITIHNKYNGGIVCTITGKGQSDLVYDGSNIWSVIADSGTVNKISVINALPTSTLTLTNTPVVTATVTPTVTAISTPFVQYLSTDELNHQTQILIQSQLYPDVLSPQYVCMYGATFQFKQYMTNDWNMAETPDRFVFAINDLRYDGTYPIKLQVNIASPPTTMDSNIITVSPFASPTP